MQKPQSTSNSLTDNPVSQGAAIELIVNDDAWPSVIDDFAFAIDAAELTLATYGKVPANARVSLAVMFSTDAHIAELNNTYRGVSKPTNVLSFPAGPTLIEETGNEPKHIGDIILARETVMREAQLENKSLKDHITHLVIHGVLHLLGYDHENESDAGEMERCETELMINLGLTDPYAVPFN